MQNPSFKDISLSKLTVLTTSKICHFLQGYSLRTAVNIIAKIFDLKESVVFEIEKLIWINSFPKTVLLGHNFSFSKHLMLITSFSNIGEVYKSYKTTKLPLNLNTMWQKLIILIYIVDNVDGYLVNIHIEYFKKTVSVLSVYSHIKFKKILYLNFIRRMLYNSVT